MDRQLSLKAILLLSTLAFPGCASSPLRPFRWWRGQTNSQPLAQRTNTESMDDGTGRVASEALTAAPPRLPAGVELPPTPTQPYASQPSTNRQRTRRAGSHRRGHPCGVPPGR